MSIESAKAFYERMVTDEAFRTQYQNASTNEERREVVLAAGYNFTPEEWETATTQIQASSSTEGELIDAQLEAVSGGAIPMYGGPMPNPFPAIDPSQIDPSTVPQVNPSVPMYGLPPGQP